MPAGMAVLVNGAMGGQEPLGLPERLEPLHEPLALAGRLVRVLRPVVQVAALSVFDVRDDLALGGGVALQLIASSRCQRSPGLGRRRRSRLAKVWANFRHQRLIVP